MSESETRQVMQSHFQKYRSEILQELQYAETAEDKSKDIIILVHNQLPYMKTCIESILKHTKNFHLYIWDNASNSDMEEYLKELMYQNPGIIDVMRSDTNVGFIPPNNELVKWGKGDYIILLNSDTKVFEGWDKAVLGFFQNNTNVAQIGYLGGVLNEEGKGYRADFGYNVDYISGFCSCISRKTYEEFGLFDHNLKFAYCEDADLSLRLKAAGKEIYSLHLMLVHHFENKTIREVQAKGDIDVVSTFEHNHKYLMSKWKEYIRTQRVDVLVEAESAV